MLKVNSISVGYGDRTVLQQVSFDLPPGSILALIGPNGVGKSTLIRALSGLLPLRAGQVCVDGRDLAGMSAQERARLMAVVPQARNLPPAFTGLEMVTLGRTPHLNWLGQTSPQDDAIVQHAMEITETLPLAGRRLAELSGGEQQRLLLARALAQAAPILLLDEPTTHLDLQYQLGLLNQVRALVHDRALPPEKRPSALVALHDLNLVARYADRVALLLGGRLRALGTPAEVLTPDLLSEVYHVPLQVITSTPTGCPVIYPLLQ